MEYLHNTTFVVEKQVEGEFLAWVSDVFIEAARRSGRFSQVDLMKILVETDPSLTNYAVLMRSGSLASAAEWDRDTACLLKDDIMARMGQRVMFFSTDMEVIQ